MNKEELIGKLQMVYVGDTNALNELIGYYDGLKQGIDELQQENQKLKEQLQQENRKLKQQLSNSHQMKNQQKEFMEYLEEPIKIITEESYDLLEVNAKIISTDRDLMGGKNGN